MTPRRASAALVFVVALLALAVAPWVSASADRRGDRVVSAESGTTIHPVRIEATGPRVAGDNASERSGADRTLRTGLVLFAVLTALLWAATSGSRGVARDRRGRSTTRSAWSPIAGRAPPSFRSSFA